MTIGTLTIKSDLVGKSFSDIQKIIKTLEASERILLQQIFQDNITFPAIPSVEHVELLQSLHQKLINKEESGNFD